MNVFKEIQILFKRSFIQTLRNPVWVLVGLSTPLLYLALFTPLLQKLAGGPGFPTSNVLDVFLPGILAFLAFGSGTGEGYTTIFELRDGLTERFRVTPASRYALLVSPVLADVVWLFIFNAVLIAIAKLFGFDVHFAGLLVSFLLIALLLIITASFSVATALLTKDISSFAAVMNGINLPILLLSGVLLPLTLAPAWMVVIAHFNPLYYVVEANRLLAAGDIVNSTVGLAFLVIIVLTIVTIWWAARVYRKAVA
jgi:ABC-2 type transport system permease protein